MRTWSLLAPALALCLLVVGCGGGGKGIAVQSPQPVASLRTMVGTTPTNAAWVAFQDGDKPWQVLAPGGVGAYSALVTDAAGRYGFAVAAPDASMQPMISVYQTTLAEMRSFTHVFSTFSPGAFTLSGNIIGATPGENAVTVALGNNIAQPQTLAPYQLASLAGGKYDLVAARRRLSPGGIDRFYARRNFQLTGNAAQDIDFTDPTDSFTPSTFNITAPDITGGSVMLQTANRTYLNVSELPTGTGTSFNYAGLPTGAAGDLYLANVYAMNASGVLMTRQMRKLSFATPGNKMLSLPALFGSPAVLISNNRLAARWNPFPNALAYNVQLSPTAGNQWSIWLSAGWLKQNTVPYYWLPNFSALPGWQLTWAPDGGDQEWTADAIVGNRPLADIAAALAAGEYKDGMEIGVTGMGVSRKQ